MYISRRNGGSNKSGLIIAVIGIIITLCLYFFLFVRVRELEAKVQRADELVEEYSLLSDKFSEYLKKSDMYFKEMDIRMDVLENKRTTEPTTPAGGEAAATGETTLDIPETTTPAAGGETETTGSPPVTEVIDISNTEGKGKKVYLTFDDGPSANTDEILDILKSYGAKATFFVNGKNEALYADYYKRITDEGHTIAMHSFTHAYTAVYSSVDALMEDMVRLRDYIVRLTGVTPDIYRFPGGSSNSITKIDIREFGKALDAEGIIYFDWNVSSEDASSVLRTADEIFNSVIAGVKSKEVPVVLMHDLQTKVTTVEALPRILEYLIQNGYEVVALDRSVEPVQHVKLDK